MTTRQVLFAAAFFCASFAAHADWKGKGEAGLVIASGNTDTDTANFKLNLTDDVADWKHVLDLSAFRASSDGLLSAERYIADWQSNYKLDDKSFVFGDLDYQNDKFSGFLYQATATAGYGYKFYDTDKTKLSVQAGAGFRELKNSVTEERTGNGVGTVGLDFEQVLTSTTKLTDKLSLEYGSANTELRNFIGVEVKVSTALALSVGYDVQRNSNPPAPLKTTDTLSTVNLVFSF